MLNYGILRYDTLESTNKKAKELADSLNHKDVIITMEQTKGRGRMDRSWVSRKGQDLIMSLVLKPTMPVTVISSLTLVMAMAVCEGLENIQKKMKSLHSITETVQGYREKALIKWPNDVVISSKKVCGILTESCLIDNKVGYVIIGCGINVRGEDFPLSLKNIAGSVKTQWGIDVDLNELLEEILTSFDKYYEIFAGDKGFHNLYTTYNERLVSIGSEVLVDGKKGMCIGVNEKGELLVDYNGKVVNILAGEVSVRGLYGYV